MLPSTGGVTAVDGMLSSQMKSDVKYFMDIGGRYFGEDEVRRIQNTVLAAYRWQYIVSGIEHPS